MSVPVRYSSFVALLAEGVDRNKEINALFNNIRVALLAEGVDRNGNLMVVNEKVADVALLAEGVDRNSKMPKKQKRQTRRPPRGGRG